MKKTWTLLAAGLLLTAAGVGNSFDKQPPREEIEFCESEGTYAICYYAPDGYLIGKSGECPKECAPMIEPPASLTTREK